MTTKNKFKFHFCIEEDSFCCGVFTTGSFELDETDEDYKDLNAYHGWGHATDPCNAKTGWRSTPKLAAQSAIAEMIVASAGRPIMMWFKRPCDYTHKVDPKQKYEDDALRQAVKRKRGVVKLRTFVNPGTRNHVDGYLLTAHATKGETIE
jgi:hypothetical protein